MRAGTAMQLVTPHVRFERRRRTDPRLGFATLLDSTDVPRVRALLRTNLTISQIAEQLGVSVAVVTKFVRRRNLCDLAWRRRLNTLIRRGRS